LKARDNKLTIEDMAGGTFTISNGGVFGSLMGTPIINLPQTGVLGLHAIKDKPVAINGKVEIRPVCSPHLTTFTWYANYFVDDVPCADIRPPFAGWQGGGDVFGQGEGIH
jgi:2-oxoacid dehydrogenases acyltransferase (catalytic domain)